jgi:condensin-2 complex subunit D3
LTTLIHLLQEDYLKMTPGFFFRILQTLGDVSEEIRDLTMFYIQQRLLKRKPKVMYNYFIESIFHFNGYEGHEIYNKMIVSQREKTLFSLSGKKYKDERMKLYRFMMEHMSDEHRFQTTYKLCQDILNGCVEGSVKLNGTSAYELLQDTLACLASDEIKLASLKSKQDGDEVDPMAEATAGDVAGAVLAAAKKTIISQVVKKNVIENIIPIVIALKHRLEKIKSPIIDDLMNYLRELMKDYKNEVKEILAADKQLATEIQFDLKKWEEEMEARKQREEEERVID